MKVVKKKGKPSRLEATPNSTKADELYPPKKKVSLAYLRVS